MRRLVSTTTIIHFFALLHAGASILLLSMGSSDEALLTLLTMTMIILLCHQEKMSLQFTIISVAVGNILGYFLGLIGADILSSWHLRGSLSNTISTFLTTEIIGWLLYFISGTTDSSEDRSSTSPLWLLLMLLVIFGIRLVMMDLFDEDLYSLMDIATISTHFMMNSLAILTLVGGDILIVSIHTNRTMGMKRVVRALLMLAATATITTLGAVMVAYNVPFGPKEQMTGSLFIRYLVMGSIIQVLLLIVIFLVESSVKARRVARDMQSKAHIAQYRYMRLKQQVNPHFLFNNLNILDYLVGENENEKASIYIRKLASIYRYMISSEEETTVPLSAEMEFVEHYIDLLLVRFPEGLEIDLDIPEHLLGRRVVPCCIQLLIENATKHNIVSGSEPLHISVVCDDRAICVTNTLNLKKNISNRTSTGIGLKYIKEQYMDMAGQNITIEDDATMMDRPAYKVTIPLL